VFDEILGLQCGLGGAARSGKGFAEDYYLDAKSQCAGKRGACPDRCVSSGVELLYKYGTLCLCRNVPFIFVLFSFKVCIVDSKLFSGSRAFQKVSDPHLNPYL
jgi:hypothetical protein